MTIQVGLIPAPTARRAVQFQKDTRDEPPRVGVQELLAACEHALIGTGRQFAATLGGTQYTLRFNSDSHQYVLTAIAPDRPVEQYPITTSGELLLGRYQRASGKKRQPDITTLIDPLPSDTIVAVLTAVQKANWTTIVNCRPIGWISPNVPPNLASTSTGSPLQDRGRRRAPSPLAGLLAFLLRR